MPLYSLGFTPHHDPEEFLEFPSFEDVVRPFFSEPLLMEHFHGRHHGDPLDGVAWAKLAQMQAKPSATATGDAGAGKAKVAADAGGVPGQKWDREAAIQHLNKSVEPASKGKCAKYVRRAIEAGGIVLRYAFAPAQFERRLDKARPT